MKKILSLLLTLCLLLGVLPSQALAYVGDIISPGSTNVQTSTNNNSLVLQNDYSHTLALHRLAMQILLHLLQPHLLLPSSYFHCFH